MRILYLLVALMLAVPSFASGKTLQEVEGLWGRYEMIGGGQDSLPGLTHVVLSFPAVERVNGKQAVWFQLEAFSGDRRLYAIALLVPALDFLYRCGLDVDVYRYLLFPEKDHPLEYVSKATGKAMIPKLDFFRNLLPHAASVDDPEMPFFVKGIYLGHFMHRLEKGKGASLLPLKEVRRLELDSDVLIGNSRSFRDDGSGRLYHSMSDWSNVEKDYTYVTFTQEDYRQMIAAGMNIFRVPLAHLQWVIEEPVYFLVRSGFENMPELLYRSNFFGAVMYMDEPVIRAMAFDGILSRFTSPQKAAELVVELTRGRYQGDGGYGLRNLNKLLRNAGYDFGKLEILQPDYPVWETVPSAAWYEMEAGVAGWLLEGRYLPKWFAGLVKSELGVDFPDDVELCIKYHHAFFTGAARRFGAKWGVAIYGQMDPEAAERVFPIAYDQGATYFWFWTSDHAHHVPFSEQLEHTRKLREYIKAHPRKATAKEWTAQAKVAIALPWGYLCDHYQMKHYTSVDTSFNTGRMWWSTKMALTDDNGHGVKYKDVLAAAVREAVNLLKEGTRFDFIFLRRGEKAEGYDEVRRVLENGQVAVE